MTSPTTLQRTVLFTVSLVVAAVIGRMGALQGSGLSLYWPVSGVIVLWALRARRWNELGAFVVVSFVVLAISFGRTGFLPLEASVLAVANLTTGLVSRWMAFALVKLGRPLGFVSRVGHSPAGVLSAQETVARLAMPYDVFRLFAAGFVGASAGSVIAMAALTLDGSAPTFAEGCVWVIRSLAGVLMVAGTGLAFRQRGRDHRGSSPWDLLFAFGLTTVLAVTAHVMSPFLPLAMTVLLPLFWSGVRSSTSVAVLHAVYTAGAVLVLAGASRGAVFGVDSESVSLSVRLHVFVIVAFLVSLVVSTAVNEYARLNADLIATADEARRRAGELRTVTETIPDALLTVDRDGLATALNASARPFVVTGPDGHPELATKRGFDDLALSENDRPWARALRGETVQGHAFAFTDATGTERTYEFNAAPLIAEGSDEPERALLLIRDVTEHHLLLRQFELMADSDPLTGLLNRRRFDRELASHVEQHRRYGHGGGLLVLDMDGFKRINDTLGHGAGDQVLIAIARILTESMRSSDVVTRLGGDEFAVLLPFADRAQMESVAGLLVDRIRTYAKSLAGAGRALTASVGGVTFASADEQGLSPLVVADMLMYEAKNSGRDGMVIMSDGDDSPPRDRTQADWKRRLERALDADELTLHLQPLVCVGTEKIVAAEALVRLVDDDVLVPPSEFVPVAERSGLAVALDRWVVRAAIAMVGRLREIEPDFSIWINVSAQSIDSEELERTLFASLEESGVPTSAVVLELTETAKVDEVAAGRAFASRLRESGIRLAIDDFGTGFGSFLYLKHLLFDYVKIDGEFITDLDSSDTDCTIVRSIVGLSGELDMQVVAEHVRSDEILEVVRSEGIDYAQGFGVGRPCTEAEFVARHLTDAAVGDQT